MSYEVLVIGGGPAGLSAALNVRARGRSVLVVSNPLEENPLWRAEKVDNYLGMPGMSGAQLLTEMRRHAEKAGVEFRTGKVLSAMRMGENWYVSIGSDMESARALVLAAGVARGKKFPGEAELLQMLGNTGLGHARSLFHAAHVAAAGGQQSVDDPQPHGVRQRFQQGRPLLIVYAFFHSPTAFCFCNIRIS